MRLLICFILLAGWFPWKGMQPTRSQARPVATAVSAPVLLADIAPTSGTGVGAACSCGNVTTSDGGTVTSQRPGVAFCSTTGLATSGITNGSLISCASGKARVEPGHDGVLGIRVESTATNAQLHSEDVSQWSLYHDGAAASDPVVTVDQAVAPDGTTTADRVDFPASGPVDGRSIFYREADTSQTKTASVYLKGVSESGSIDMTFTGATPVYTVCTFDSTTWTRCTLTATSSITGQLEIGPNTVRTGNTYAATSVYVWGIQQERGYNATSYIKTTGTTATRNADYVYFTLVNGATPMCASAAASFPGKLYTADTAPAVWHVWTSSANAYYAELASSGNFTTSTVNVRTVVANTIMTVATDSTVSAGSTNVVAWKITSGTTVIASIDSTSKTGTFSAFTPWTTSSSVVQIGMKVGGGQGLNGIVSKIKVGSSATDCQ